MLAGANARKAQVTAQYALAVQGAFKNVHDATQCDRVKRGVGDHCRQTHRRAASGVGLANLRYTNGYSSYHEVLNA